jgi:small subunit ribosomal protein S21
VRANPGEARVLELWCGCHVARETIIFRVSLREVSSIVGTVQRRDGESLDQLMRRFRKSVTSDGVLSTLRRKRYHISRGELERIKKRKGIQRARRRELRRAAKSKRTRR